jgi:hypothetical protein
MKIDKKLLIIVMTFFFTICIVPNALAFKDPFKVFGRDLVVKGSIQQNLDLRTHRDERDVQYSSLKTTLRVEGDYHIYNSAKLDVSFYTLLHYWYDNGDNIENNLRDSIRFEDNGSHALKNYRRSNEIEEVMKEFYLDLRGRTWQARLGRQIVSWGETSLLQVADIINPLDLFNLKAFPDFDDLKVGLWMARLFWTPEAMWQDLSFEFIFIPPDFQPTRLPPAGSPLFFGTPVMGEDTFGKILSKQRRDTPANDWSNTEFGLRIRGFTWDTSWTLSYFYSRRDDPIIDGRKGFNNFTRLLLGLPDRGKVFTYPHTQTVGFTFDRPLTKIRSTLRGETTLLFKDYQYGTFEVKSRKLFVNALSLDRKIYIPWLTPLNRMRYMGATVTWFYYKLIDHKHNKATGEYIDWESGTRDSSWNVFSVMLDYGFLFDQILPSFNFAYDINGGTTVVGALKYAPGDHWRYQVTYQQTNEQGRNKHMQDQVMFSVQYEF